MRQCALVIGMLHCPIDRRDLFVVQIRSAVGLHGEELILKVSILTSDSSLRAGDRRRRRFAAELHGAERGTTAKKQVSTQTEATAGRLFL